ncbi:MAG: rane-bound lytic murein transglycosylase B-like protein [Deltaproteobacteria bacterium]|nr:rane-bound lytic murein transglycosylase B-like protein [Deltaproteobacteria bacterium]
MGRAVHDTTPIRDRSIVGAARQAPRGHDDPPTTVRHRVRTPQRSYRPLVWLLVLLTGAPLMASADDRGWGYLIEKLVADGVNRESVVQTFQDPRIDRFTGLVFSPQRPREPRAWYRRFLRPRSVAAARRCRDRYRDEFDSAARQHGVPASVLTAILFVESSCGGNTGSHIVLTRLARLAMANAPDNLQYVLDSYADATGSLSPALARQIRERAEELERTFYPEVRAVFTIAERADVAPLDLRGSSAGAFGFPQFLPTSYLAYGIDADGDGRVSLNDPADAIVSCGYYFAQHGWRSGLSRAERRSVIWQYNHSDAYVDTILNLAVRIDGRPATIPVMAKKQPPRRRPKKHATTTAAKPLGKPVTTARRDLAGTVQSR